MSDTADLRGLRGRIVVVTGASSGIGAAIAGRFAAEGSRVVGASRRATPIPGVESAVCDVTDAESVDGLVADVVARHGRLDVMINNAGVQVERTIAETSDEEYDLVMDTNVRGVFHGTRAAVRVMLAADPRGGVVVNIGSTAATHADRGMAIYDASKGAVEAMTRAVATDHGGDGIRCVTVAPGWVATEMAAAAFEVVDDPAAARRAAIAAHPVGRLGTPADIAATVVFAASDDAAFLSGTTITVDGGATSASPVRP